MKSTSKLAMLKIEIHEIHIIEIQYKLAKSAAYKAKSTKSTTR